MLTFKMLRLPFLALFVSSCFIGAMALNRTISAATAERFHRWAEKYNMQFHGSEKTMRMRIFAANLDMINAHNKKKSSYKLRLNKFAHLTFAEFSSKYLGLKSGDAKCDNAMRDGTSARTMEFTHAHVAAPAAVDWRSANAVTSIKDQGECGECALLLVIEALIADLDLATSSLCSQVCLKAFIIRQAGRQAGKQAGRQGGRQAGKQAGRQGGRQARRQVGGQPGRQAGRKAGRQACQQAGRQAGRLADWLARLMLF